LQLIGNLTRNIKLYIVFVVGFCYGARMESFTVEKAPKFAIGQEVFAFLDQGPYEDNVAVYHAVVQSCWYVVDVNGDYGWIYELGNSMTIPEEYIFESLEEFGYVCF
jgi:hypothetical protein